MIVVACDTEVVSDCIESVIFKVGEEMPGHFKGAEDGVR